MQKVKYVGQRAKLHVNFPVPYLSHADKEGEVEFTKGQTHELKNEWAAQLVKTSPAIFVYDDADLMPKKKAKKDDEDE